VDDEEGRLGAFGGGGGRIDDNDNGSVPSGKACAGWTFNTIHTDTHASNSKHVRG
jgi:hypothetical protein